jgi:hypothetical protein
MLIVMILTLQDEGFDPFTAVLGSLGLHSPDMSGVSNDALLLGIAENIHFGNVEIERQSCLLVLLFRRLFTAMMPS